MNHRRHRGAALLVVLSMGVLTGCENAYHFGSFALRDLSGRYVMAVCEAVTIESLYLEERGSLPGNAGRRHVWEASGDRNVAAGDELTVGGENPGLVNDLTIAFDLNPGNRYFFETNDGSGATTSALFEVPAGGIPSGMWLDPHGEILPEPCP